jgi:hypothetical protein
MELQLSRKFVNPPDLLSSVATKWNSKHLFSTICWIKGGTAFVAFEKFSVLQQNGSQCPFRFCVFHLG